MLYWLQGERWENVKVARWQKAEISSSRSSWVRASTTFSWICYLQRYQMNLISPLQSQACLRAKIPIKSNTALWGAWSLAAGLMCPLYPCKVGSCTEARDTVTVWRMPGTAQAVQQELLCRGSNALLVLQAGGKQSLTNTSATDTECLQT